VRRTAPGEVDANYTILGPYDYLDIVEAPDETATAKAVMISTSRSSRTKKFCR